MKQWMIIEVQGRNKLWSWHVKEDPRYLKEWQKDGIKISILCNTIPDWVVGLGLARIWYCLQDLWNNCVRLW